MKRLQYILLLVVFFSGLVVGGSIVNGGIMWVFVILNSVTGVVAGYTVLALVGD